jgi:hypothetical protein
MVGFRDSSLTTNAKRTLPIPDNDGPGGKEKQTGMSSGERASEAKMSMTKQRGEVYHGKRRFFSVYYCQSQHCEGEAGIIQWALLVS